MRGLLLLVFGLWAQAAMAQGFAVHDLTGLAEAARSALGPAATARAEAGQLGLHCAACAGAPTIALRLGRLTDGTEARVRSGRTTLAALEALCVRRNPDCRLSALPAGPAIGWLSVYALDGGAGATAVILRDGDLLTIEARASDRGAAEDAARRLMQAVLPRIVGPETLTDRLRSPGPRNPPRPPPLSPEEAERRAMTDQTGRPAREGAEAAVADETETPREKLGQMEDKARSDTDFGEAIDRATAAVGQDDGKR